MHTVLDIFIDLQFFSFGDYVELKHATDVA